MSIQAILYRKGSELVTVSPRASLRTAAEKLGERNVPALVVKDGEAVLGVISEREIVDALARHGDKIASMTVADIAERDVLTVAPEDGLKRTIARMTRHGKRHLVVLRDSKLAGIVSAGDVFKYRLEDLETEKRFSPRFVSPDAVNGSLGRETRHV
jgi:CBS domain-containing protein